MKAFSRNAGLQRVTRIIPWKGENGEAKMTPYYIIYKGLLHARNRKALGRTLGKTLPNMGISLSIGTILSPAFAAIFP